MKAEPRVPTVLRSHFQAIQTEKPPNLAATSHEDWQSLVTDQVAEIEKYPSLENDNQPKIRKVEEMLGKTTD